MMMQSRVTGNTVLSAALCALLMLTASASAHAAGTAHRVRMPVRASGHNHEEPAASAHAHHSSKSQSQAALHGASKPSQKSLHGNAQEAVIKAASHSHTLHISATRESPPRHGSIHVAPIERAAAPAAAPKEPSSEEAPSASEDLTGIHHNRRPEAGQTTKPATSSQTDSSKATTQDLLRAAGVAVTPNPVTPNDAKPAASENDQAAGNRNLPLVAPRPAISATDLAEAEATAERSAAVPAKPVSGKAAARNLMPADRNEEARVIDAALTPTVLPKLFTRSGRLIVPPPMKGSHDILVHQNTMADSEGLSRIQDDDDLDRMRAQHLLVPIETSARLTVNDELPFNRRYARPWTAQFVSSVSRDFYAKFHEPLRLNSAVRTVEYQLRLQRVNGNAAAVEGETASPHLTGQAIDFGKKGMSAAQIAWMRLYLAPLMSAGKLDVEEEFQQACFHISVYKNYVPGPVRRAARTEVAQLEKTDSKQ